MACTFNELSGITYDSILDHVVPNMRLKGYDRRVCLVWGCAVLFCIFDARGYTAASLPIQEQIMRAFNDLEVRNGLERIQTQSRGCLLPSLGVIKSNHGNHW